MDSNHAPPGRARRAQLVEHEAARAVLAAIETLDPALQHDVFSSLRERLAVVELAPADVRTQRGVAALREAAVELGRPPSIADYRMLAAREPGRFPPDGSVRRWLGGSWNDALRRARLDTVADGDVLVQDLGSKLSTIELTDALKACSRDLGEVPSLSAYLGWAHRPDVRARPGRRPLSQGPFDRGFGGYLNALRAARLVRDGVAVGVPHSTRVRAGSYFITDEQIVDAIREVAAALGRSPRSAEYRAQRERVIADSYQAGEIRTLPGYGTIQRRFGDWDSALLAAGLATLGGRSTGAVGRRASWPRGKQFSDEQLVDVLREAHRAVGEPFSSPTYTRWRRDQTARDKAAQVHRRLPSYHVYWQRFGSWENAVARAIHGRQSA